MRRREWIIVLGAIALGATLIFFGSLLLIWSYALGSSIGVMLNPVTLLFGGFGCSMIALGTIVVLKLFEERKLEWIIISGATALGATLLFFGLFFFIAGVWSVLSGNGARPAGLEYLVMLFGGSMMYVGVIVVLKLVETTKREWITVVRIVSSATLLFFGLFFLTWGGLWSDLILMIIGGPLMIAGILTLLRTVK